jgi:hypothetical protein
MHFDQQSVKVADVFFIRQVRDLQHVKQLSIDHGMYFYLRMNAVRKYRINISKPTSYVMHQQV